MPGVKPTMLLRKGSAICVVGASHARVLAAAMKPISTAPVSHITVMYPRQLTAAIGNYGGACGIFIVGIGQYPAGWPEHRPYLVEEYRNAMTTALAAMVEAVAPVSVMLRTVHPNPMGDGIGMCPPADWRNPLVIDAYNSVLPGVCHKTGAHFVDSSSLIVMPLWDSADDWCHYHGRVATAEAEYYTFKTGTFNSTFKTAPSTSVSSTPPNPNPNPTTHL